MIACGPARGGRCQAEADMAPCTCRAEITYQMGSSACAGCCGAAEAELIFATEAAFATGAAFA